MKANLKLVWKNLEEILASIFLVTVISILILQVFARYELVSSAAWTEEVLKYSFLAMIYFASGIGAKEGTHFRVSFFVDKLPKQIKFYVDVVGMVIWLTFNISVIYSSILYMQTMMEFTYRSQILEIDMVYVFAIIPVAFVLQTIRLVNFMIVKFENRKSELEVGIISHE